MCSLQGSDASALIVKAGPSIMQGLLATLLAVSAVSRVHKVCSIFLELTGIQHNGRQTAADAIVDWLRSAIQQLPNGEASLNWGVMFTVMFTSTATLALLQPASSTELYKHVPTTSLLTELCDTVGLIDINEETSFLAECYTLLRAVAEGRDEATAARNRPDASVIHNFAASRNLKKHLRGFAERHQLDIA